MFPRQLQRTFVPWTFVLLTLVHRYFVPWTFVLWTIVPQNFDPQPTFFLPHIFWANFFYPRGFVLSSQLFFQKSSQEQKTGEQESGEQ